VRGGAVGVAVPVQAGQLGRQRIPPRRRGRLGRLVGVEADPDRHLGRVVALERLKVVADGHAGHGGPPNRSRIESACAGSCSSSASATTWAPTLRSAASSRWTTWTCLVKSATVSAWPKRAEPNV